MELWKGKWHDQFQLPVEGSTERRRRVMASAVAQWAGPSSGRESSSYLEALPQQIFHRRGIACYFFSELVAVVTAMQDRREGWGGEGREPHPPAVHQGWGSTSPVDGHGGGGTTLPTRPCCPLSPCVCVVACCICECLLFLTVSCNLIWHPLLGGQD